MYPWKSTTASNKWHFLYCKGYVSDRRNSDNTGLIFYWRDNPKGWGEIDWWGKVTWRGE